MQQRDGAPTRPWVPQLTLPPPCSPTQEFWLRLLCYIMETDYTEALTPICISLTNLAERQLHTKDVEASVAGKSRHGGQPPCHSL